MPWGSPAQLWRLELASLGVAQYLRAVVYCADVGWRKPASPPFWRVLELLKAAPLDSVFVGDDPRWDLAGPKALGMPSLLLDRAGQLDLPGERVIRNLGELLDIINLPPN